ncbi:MAG: DUF1549 domain-containing protein [Pirellulaceae bacterium]|nr:DUF1549 domain-containing protein [Pirellulaceae bacterium]
MTAVSAQDRKQSVDFIRDIQPIISENCNFCHGPDEEQRQADLRLDVEDEAISVIQRHSREDSELFARLIASDDPDTLMPPPESNRKLTADQIELIGRWIDQGAQWEQHWSFRPIEKPTPPQFQPFDGVPIHNQIDAFVQQRLRLESMAPAPAADRRTLIRRLSLDLTGLPPTPTDVTGFVNDTQPDAYDRLVQRLLDSPAFGQRMAWDWLDAARYADTNGYQGDRERTMWPWRDWVTRAFNENLPFDQFTIWQLAGDQLPDATLEQKLATGFCRNHPINGEGGRIAEENRVEYVMDMSETMGTVWLGLTLNCCRCHDHKYDPITNEEYYQFFAFFNQTPVKGSGGDPQTAPVISVPDAQQTRQLAKLNEQIASADQQLRELSKTLVDAQADWERERTNELSTATQWEILDPEKSFANRQRMRVLADQSILTAGPNPDNDTYTVLATPKNQTITGVRLEALRHDTMTKGGLARSDSGNFVLTSMEIAIVDPNDPDSTTPISIESADATFEQGGWKITDTFDDDPQTGWAVYQGKPVDRDHAAIWRFASAIDVPAGAQLEFVLRHDSKHKNHNLGRFRLSVATHDRPELTSEDDELIAALKTEPKQRSDEQNKAIGKAHRESDATYQSVKQKRDGLAKQLANLQKKIPRVMVMEDMAESRKSFVLERGIYNKPTDEVERAFPEFLPRGEIAKQTPNRLALARWLVDDANPLTARVTVNRFWQQFFGIGLVKTTEDFGRQGETPIHLNLLNWLAADFRGNDWNVKELLRKIVTSHTYRQSSKMTPDLLETDPHNRLLARGARHRMPSWMLRDQALAVSGLLSSVNEGPAVNTYQPPGIWEEASFGKKTYQQDTGEKLYRRSLYTFWRRIIAPTMFFDNATRQTCTVKTARTNTPLHALQTFNNVAYVEAARALAELALQSDATSADERIDFILQRVLARGATEAEKTI